MAHDDNFNQYRYDPNLAVNIVGLVLYAIVFMWHNVLNFYYRLKWFGVAFFIGLGLETVGFIGRVLSSQDPFKRGPFMIQIICLTLAPGFIMAGVYYLLAKLVVIYGPHLSRFKPMQYSYLFISADLTSIVLQGIGGGIASGADNGTNQKIGSDIMVGGLAFQAAAMAVFFYCFCEFMYKVCKLQKLAKSQGLDDSPEFDPKYLSVRQRSMMKYLPYSMGVCIITIFIRCVYRVVELGQGWTGFLITHEPYFLILDALMVIIGTYAIAIAHPGIAFGRAHIYVPKFKRKVKKSKNTTEFADETQDSLPSLNEDYNDTVILSDVQQKS